MGQPTNDILKVALVSVHADPLLPIGSEEAGGQNVYVRELARALARRGHMVDVFTRNRSGGEIEIKSASGFRVFRLPAGPTGFIPRSGLFPHLPGFVHAFEQVVRMEDVHHDVIHSNYWLSGWVGRTISKKWMIPQAHTSHSLGKVKYSAGVADGTEMDTRFKVETDLIRNAAIVATSPQEYAAMSEYYESPGNFRIIPCGVDDSVFYPRKTSRIRREFGVRDGESLLVYAGRFNPGKGIDVLVRAFARMCERLPAKLVIVGGYDRETGDHVEYLKIVGLVGELGLGDRVIFPGKLDAASLSEFYSAADACVVPSHYESFGLVALESMACGTPVVASDVGGLACTVINGSTGMRVSAGDVEAFADSMAHMCTDSRMRSEMGINCAKMVADGFTWSVVAGRVEDYYRKIIKNGTIFRDLVKN
ncbi:MAG: glycosyltransferase [bacterium]|nr:glycosyltransferase [bacterium]